MHTAILTRITLNPANHAARRDLADHPGLHRTLMRLAPDNLGPHPRRKAGLLFRLEPHPHHPTLLVQTASPPQLPRLPHGYGTTEIRNLKPLLDALEPGRRVRYRITANPSSRTHTRGEHSATAAVSRHGTVIALHGDDALAWWHRRAGSAGLTLENTVMAPRPFLRSNRETGPYHRLIQFDGTAHITDLTALTEALCTGIGKAKSYGAGLLSLAPA